ncbi:hypothetical protein CN380_19295 [Bacillus sp. AFS017274]|nr:hypothetical protein CN380_19295 [Bacillus sp. AFS017274]
MKEQQAFSPQLSILEKDDKSKKNLEKMASRDAGDACFDEAWQAVCGKGVDFRKRVCVMISTPGTRFPRAVREPPRRTCACGVSLGRVFPQESRTLHSNQLCLKNPDILLSSK